MRQRVGIGLLARGHTEKPLLRGGLRGEQHGGADAARLAVVVADAEMRLLGHVRAFDVRRVHAVHVGAGHGGKEQEGQRQSLHGVTTSTMPAPSLA